MPGSALRASWGGLFTAIGTVGYYTAYAYIAWQTLAGAFSVGDLTFLAGSFRRLRTLLEGLLASFSSTAGQALYLDDLFSFFEVAPEIMSPEIPLPFPKPIAQGFVFEDVGFRYPGAERWAVRGLSFTLKAGEVVALVGENGAGKTTLVKLLARLYDPDEGRILLDGHDLRDYDLDALRGNMGVIFQDFVRYNLSAADNITVGMIEERDDRPRIIRTAERSQADEVIARLPGGYDQMIGKRFKKGVELSGKWPSPGPICARPRCSSSMSPRQHSMRAPNSSALPGKVKTPCRKGIAPDRYVGANPCRRSLATSPGFALVFKRFKELSAGKTAVLISHRFSSARMADRILVLAGGRVEAAGTHEELLAQPGRYSNLFELQAAGYR